MSLRRATISNNPIHREVPPDMAILLQQLENDFNNKVIDQWIYINKREEILNKIDQLEQKKHKEMTKMNLNLQKPLNPRNTTNLPNKSDNLIKILKNRSKLYKDAAVITLDSKGKEISSITWEKLYLKSMKIAYNLRTKSGLSKNDNVVLIYRDNEVSEFITALFGCFLAGLTAIPIHLDVSLSEIIEIMELSSAKLSLISETISKEFDRISTANPPTSKIPWPKNMKFWRTTDLGSAKKTELEDHSGTSDLAYIEFSRSPVGELRGIAISHRTIMHQMNSVDETLSSMPNSGGSLKRSHSSNSRQKRSFLCTLDTRFSIGLILGLLFTVYSGNVLYWAPSNVMETQGLYAHLVSRFKISLLLADHIGLKRVTYDYQQSPNTTRYFSKTTRVDFSSVKWCLVNCLTIDGESLDILSERWLKPLGCREPENAVIPMLTLSEYGGMVISLRDWLGGKELLGIENESQIDDESFSSALSEMIIDKEALSRNIVKVIDTNPSDFIEDNNSLRVGAFGYPLPDATLAVVNPETNYLANKGELGEIWIDSPCLSGGFYALRNESKTIFHAKCYDENGLIDLDFLRTGLLGFTFNGKVYVLGLYEDRIRQRISWIDKKVHKKLKKDLVIGNGTRYHYCSHLLATLASDVKDIYDCTIFDIFNGNEYLPVAIVEAEIARGTPTNNNTGGPPTISPVPLNEASLNAIAQRCFESLYKNHLLRLYCVMVVDCDTLPKIMRSGGKEIANMLCKRRFLDGSLKSEFVKFFVQKAISNIPIGEDIIGGIWSPYISNLRSTALLEYPQQFSSIDYRNDSLDEKTKVPLTDFKSIVDILKLRVARSPDETAFQTIDGVKGGKSLSWRKFEARVYALCSYLIDKSTVKPGQYVILMYSLSEEFIIAVYACLMTGIIPIPMLPFDSNRIGEDFPAFLGIIRDFAISEVLVNEDIEKFLKSGPVADALKKVNSSKRIKVPKIKNTGKFTKSVSIASLNPKISKCQAAVNFRDDKTVALVWLSFTSDHYRVAATLSHKNIIGVCKVFKETCNLNTNSPILGCVRHSAGIGFIQAALLGVFLGTTTYLMSPVRYAENPLTFYLTLARHKIKDTYVTDQMLKYASLKFSPKGFNLAELKNMMIGSDDRVEVDLLQKITRSFNQTRLGQAALATVYNHPFNPIISTRSYVTVAPIDLYLDPIALRQGYVSVVNPVDNPSALHLQDSGMVPVCTEIAIVNPETRRACREGEFGEIWVCSEANLTSFTNGPRGPKDNFTKHQFLGKIKDGNPDMTYLRTGDLGFLHNVSVSKNDSNVNGEEVASFQPLFVLGKISDTFEVMGLHHFPVDIESTVESCHPDIYKNGSCIFKCADYTVVVCESKRSRWVSSLVPLIVNSVLSKHHIIVDIVAFMKKGEFPISRLGQKQRARIVDAWVQNVLPTTSSYGINYGENSMIKLVKEIESISREDSVTGIKNPALSYYDDEDYATGDNNYEESSSQSRRESNGVYNTDGSGSFNDYGYDNEANSNFNFFHNGNAFASSSGTVSDLDTTTQPPKRAVFTVDTSDSDLRGFSTHSSAFSSNSIQEEVHPNEIF